MLSLAIMEVPWLRYYKKLPVFAGCAAVLSLLGAVIYILFLFPGDISADRTGNQRVFGATWPT